MQRKNFPSQRLSGSSVIFLVCFLEGMGFPARVAGAPLDEFLTAQRGFSPLHGEYEISFDVMNNKVDIANIRGRDTTYANTDVGDYRGGHIYAGVALTRRLWVDGSLWSRAIQTPQEPLDGFSWQRAIQYQLTVNLGKLPALALRFSQWGNSAKGVSKKTTLLLGDNTVDNVDIMKPSDEQTQIDLIGTWNVTKKDSFSVFVGGGTSKIGFKDFIATMSNNCRYKLDSPSKYQIAGQLVGGTVDECQLVAFDINDPSPRYPGPDMMQMKYKATYQHLGGMYQWFNEAWRFRLGARYEMQNRSMDEDLRASGIPYFDSNTLITTEVGYKPYKKVAFFVRAQMMNHQLLSEIPFSYNRFTSSKFGRQYGLLNFGLQGGF
ncbi:MAG: hypothetical protein HQL63_08125 [Magnetococcales bacterium]|nr:hypothetical protein [Magnetococcales bacterium]